MFQFTAHKVAHCASNVTIPTVQVTLQPRGVKNMLATPLTATPRHGKSTQQQSKPCPAKERKDDGRNVVREEEGRKGRRKEEDTHAARTSHAYQSQSLPVPLLVGMHLDADRIQEDGQVGVHEDTSTCGSSEGKYRGQVRLG